MRFYRSLAAAWAGLEWDPPATGRIDYGAWTADLSLPVHPCPECRRPLVARHIGCERTMMAYVMAPILEARSR